MRMIWSRKSGPAISRRWSRITREGLKRFTSIARPKPRYFTACSTIALLVLSPSREALRTVQPVSLLVSPPTSSNAFEPLPSAKAFRIRDSRAAVPVNQPTTKNHGSPNAGTIIDINHVTYDSARAEDSFRDCLCAGLTFDQCRDSELFLEYLFHGNVSPELDGRGSNSDSFVGINQTWVRNADSD